MSCTTQHIIVTLKETENSHWIPSLCPKHPPRSWQESRGVRGGLATIIAPYGRRNHALAEVVCFKCGKKGHFARNCTEKTFHARGVTEKVGLFGEGEVNGQHVRRIQIDSGASRTVVKRSLISPLTSQRSPLSSLLGMGLQENTR